MKIRFKDGTTRVCHNPKEIMLFRNGKKAVWLFSFAMPADAQDIDKVLTEDNISEIGIMNNDETQGYSKGGYDAVEGVERSN